MRKFLLALAMGIVMSGFGSIAYATGGYFCLDHILFYCEWIGGDIFVTELPASCQ